MKNRLTKKLKNKGKISDKKSSIAMITVPLHGPVVTSDEILSMIFEQTGLKPNSSIQQEVSFIDLKNGWSQCKLQ